MKQEQPTVFGCAGAEYNTGMNRKHSLIALVAGVVVIGAGIVFWFLTPRILSFQPTENKADVPAFTPLKITFTRKMDPESVAAHIGTIPPHHGKIKTDGRTILFYPEIPWESSGEVTVTVHAGARSETGLPLLRGVTWHFRVAETRLAYLSPLAEPSDLFVLEPKAGNIKRLTNAGRGINDFSPSPDGMMLYYSAPNGRGGSDIYSLSLVNGETRRLIDCAMEFCKQPLVSPDNHFLAFLRAEDGSGADAWVMRLPAGDARRVSGEDEHADDLRWTPENTLAYFIRSRKLVVLVNPVSGEQSQIGKAGDSLGVWSPDGRWYLTTVLIPVSIENLKSAISSHLVLYDMQSGQTVDLTVKPDIEDATPVFSPDGTWIAFGRKYLNAEDWTPGRQLWLMKTDGSEAHPLTDAPAMNHVGVHWSPDGKRIAFLRFDQTSIVAPPEVWMVEADGSGLLRLVIDAYAVQWIP